MVLLIIIPIKWLFHWEYTLFSDKPKCSGRCEEHDLFGFQECLKKRDPQIIMGLFKYENWSKFWDDLGYPFQDTGPPYLQFHAERVLPMCFNLIVFRHKIPKSALGKYLGQRW